MIVYTKPLPNVVGSSLYGIICICKYDKRKGDQSEIERDLSSRASFWSNLIHYLEHTVIMSEQGDSLAANPAQQPLRSDAVIVLKRPASPSFEGLQENTCRKMVKEDTDGSTACQSNTESPSISNNNVEISLVEELAQELQCGCCSELVYRPVVVAPCQHFFCGR
jgi:hypothetical protein